MADFDIQGAQAFQNRVIESVRAMERLIDARVLPYRNDRIDNETDSRENLRSMHGYLRDVYRELGALLTDMERRF